MTSPLFSLSKTAEEQISKLLVNNSNAIGLKIGLSTKGCAGLSYTMEYVNNDSIQGCELVNDYKFPLYIEDKAVMYVCLLYTSPSPRDVSSSRMPSSA